MSPAERAAPSRGRRGERLRGGQRGPGGLLRAGDLDGLVQAQRDQTAAGGRGQGVGDVREPGIGREAGPGAAAVAGRRDRGEAEVQARAYPGGQRLPTRPGQDEGAVGRDAARRLQRPAAAGAVSVNSCQNWFGPDGAPIGIMAQAGPPRSATSPARAARAGRCGAAAVAGATAAARHCDGQRANPERPAVPWS